MALLAGVEGEVAEGALVTFAVLVAGVHAGLALALLGGAVLAVGVVAAVTGDAAAAAKADRAFAAAGIAAESTVTASRNSRWARLWRCAAT